MKKIILILVFSILFCIPCSASSTEKKAVIEPKASVVFNSVSASINRTAYAGNCTLVDYGSGNIEVILQFLNPVYSGWQTYKSNKVTTSFSNKVSYGAGGYYTLPAGTYRSKTIVTATVNGVTESRTVYSPELTVY